MQKGELTTYDRKTVTMGFDLSKYQDLNATPARPDFKKAYEMGYDGPVPDVM